MRRYTTDTSCTMSRLLLLRSSRTCLMPKWHVTQRTVMKQVGSDSTSSKQSVFERVRAFIRNDPFVKVSLIFVGIILSVGIGFETFEKYKSKKIKKSVSTCIWPNSFCGHVVQRHHLVSELETKFKQQMLGTKTPCVIITGPTGCGKTELARQFAVQFRNAHSGVFRKIDSFVLTFSASSLETMEFSLKNALCMFDMEHKYLNQFSNGLPFDQLPLPMKIKALCKAIPAKLIHPSGLLIFDDVGDDVASCIEAVLDDVHCNVLILTTNHKCCPKGTSEICLKEGFTVNEALELLNPHSQAARDYLISFMNNVTSLPWALSLLGNLTNVPDLSLFKGCDSESCLRELISLNIQHGVAQFKDLREILDVLVLCHPDYPLPTDVIQKCCKMFNGSGGNGIDYVSRRGDAASWFTTSSAMSFECGLQLPCVPLYSVGTVNDSLSSSYVKLHKAAHHLLSSYSISEMKDITPVSKLSTGISFSSANVSEKEIVKHLPGLESSYLGGKSGILGSRDFLHMKPIISRKLYLRLVSRHHIVLDAIIKSAKAHCKVAFYMDSLIPHIQYIVNKGKLSIPLVSLSDQARALSFLGMSMRHRDVLQSARSCRRAVEIFQKLNGYYHLTVAESLKNEAIVYYSGNQLQKAKECLESSLKIYNRIPQRFEDGSQLSILADTLSLFGVVLTALKDWSGSKETLEQALQLHRMTPLGENSISLFDAATTMSDLGLVNLHMGDMNTARKLLEESIVIHRNSNDPVEIVRSLQILCHVYSLLGRTDQVQSLERELQKLTR